MEEIMKILKRVKPDIGEISNLSEHCLVTDKILDSIEMMEVVSEIEEAFDIEIGMEYLDASHFDSIKAICQMVDELTANKS